MKLDLNELFYIAPGSKYVYILLHYETTLNK